MTISVFQISTTQKNITIKRYGFEPFTTNSISEILNYFCNIDETLMAWDIDETLSHIFKRLPKLNLIELHKTAKTTYQSFKLFYIMGKVFSISSLHESEFKPHNTYHLMQYFPNDTEPTSLQQVNLKATDLLNALKEMGYKSEKFSSAVAIFESCVLDHLELPTIKSSNIPKEASLYSWKCSGKLWIEAYQIGRWE